MLGAVASMLEKQLHATGDVDTHIVFISMNTGSTYQRGDDAYAAVLSRIAWELSGRETALSRFQIPTTVFSVFQNHFTGFASVLTWLTRNKVILLVDELNLIPPESPNYRATSEALDELVGRKGSALLYSTHHRNTEDLLCKRIATEDSKELSERKHAWLLIPRVKTENCLKGLRRNTTFRDSYWSAVLRGRVPALIVLDKENVPGYAARETLVTMKQQSNRTG